MKVKGGAAEQEEEEDNCGQRSFAWLIVLQKLGLLSAGSHEYLNMLKFFLFP